MSRHRRRRRKLTKSDRNPSMEAMRAAIAGKLDIEPSQLRDGPLRGRKAGPDEHQWRSLTARLAGFELIKEPVVLVRTRRRLT
ncbi:hypothetical protein [Allorhodopirellula solitaria]|uniref:hypothetical protein n=1 Tax=Allorhodopirellula solitaria TaxID=2527987 RepID=UPI0011B70647|nr:hypothetical protein [Allorhodopirellula solitaria]